MPISMFDVAGPIMVGPSSSHTAGACKLGQMARALFCGTPVKATFYLHGSFATVYQGHATDRALVAGVLKMVTSSPHIKDALEIADTKGLKYEFIPTELGEEHHPNTVKIVLEKPGKVQTMIGSSIGGGKVQLTHINDIPVDLEASVGRYFSLLVGHDNNPEVLHQFCAALKKMHCPIAEQETSSMGENSVTLFNIEDHPLKLPEVLQLERISGIHFVRALTKILK